MQSVFPSAKREPPGRMPEGLPRRGRWRAKRAGRGLPPGRTPIGGGMNKRADEGIGPYETGEPFPPVGVDPQIDPL